MDQVLHAIVEPRRRTILKLVQSREMTAGDIASHFEISRPAISQHLKVLSDAGLLGVRRAGTRRLYRAQPEGLAELRQFIEEMWDSKLALLKQAAETEEDRHA